jgi:hypothetical protein
MQRSKIYLAILFHVFAVLQFSLGWLHDLLNLVERHCKKRLSDGKWRLAGYTEENPKISTACGHHFHLACIYGWMEYSKHCPMCDKVMSVLISAHTVFLLPCSLLADFIDLVLVGPSLLISLDLLHIC